MSKVPGNGQQVWSSRPVSIRKPPQGALTWNKGAKTGDRAELKDPGGAGNWQ